MDHRPPVTIQARTQLRELRDSGGPVVSRSGGVVYGIIKSTGLPDGDFPRVMVYTRISQFFTEQPGYSPAPA